MLDINHWSGTLGLENIQDVATAIEQKLCDKAYTFVSVYEYMNYKPETRINQRLVRGKNGSFMSLYFDDKNDPPTFAGFNFCDTYGVWGLSTSQPQGGFDPTCEAPYIEFTHTGITMNLRTPAGLWACWQITLEE